MTHDLDAIAESLLSMDWQPLLQEPAAPLVWTVLTDVISRQPLDRDVLWGIDVLGAIASMMLLEDGTGPEYGPFAQFSGRRTRIPSDLSQEELGLLRRLAPDMPHLELSARAADIVWLRSDDRRSEHDMALLAVEQRLKQDIREETWYEGVEASFARAITMAKALSKRDQLEEARSRIVAQAQSSKSPTFVLRLVRFLDDYGLAAHAPEVTDLVMAAIEETPEQGGRRAGLELLRLLQLKSGLGAEAANTGKRVADEWVLEAESREALVAASFMENALQVLKTIPGQYRDSEVTTMLQDLPKRIRKAGEEGVSAMQTLTTDSVDLTDAVQVARGSVSGRSLEEALANLCRMAPVDSFLSARTAAEKLASGSVAALFSHTTLGADGRKLHSSEVENPYDLPSSVWHLMHQNFGIRVGVIATAVLNPALEVIRMEHRVDARAFDLLADRCSFIPPQARPLFRLGLAHGYRGDYAAATHLLIPQVETAIRYHLRSAGVETDRLDPRTLISNEVGLSTLMKSPEVETLFGPDLVWEIRALLSGPGGLNLRNSVAHGIADPSQVSGSAGLYVWWFCLRLAFVAFWNAKHSSHDGDSQESDDDA